MSIFSISVIQVNREKTGLVGKVTEYAMGLEFVRNMIFKKAREQVMKMTGGLYPAPLKVRRKESIFFFQKCSNFK